MGNLKSTLTPIIAALLLLLASVSIQVASPAKSQESAPQSAQDSTPEKKRKSVIFYVFKNYFSDKFPNHKAGILMLNPQKPSGMFLVYPDKGETTQQLMDKVKSLVAGMFFHVPESKVNVTWTASALPKHKGVENESGTLFAASDEKHEAQLAFYVRNFDGTEIAYGYFSNRKKDSKSEEGGQFLDSSGGGVEDFDKFWKSIRESK